MIKTNPDSKVALLIFFTFLTFYIMTTGGHAYTDEYQQYEVTKRIIDEGRLDVTEEVAEKYWKGSFKRGVDGKLYAAAPPTWALSLIPFALLAKSLNLPPVTWILYGSTMVAGTCSLLFLFSRKLGFSTKLSLTLTVIFGLATMAWPYSKTGISPMMGTLSLVGSIYLLYSHRFDADAKKWHFIAGALCALSVAIRYDYAIFIPFLILFHFITIPRDKFSLSSRSLLVIKSRFLSIIFFIIPLFILSILVALYNHIIWGSVLRSRTVDIVGPSEHTSFVGIFGILVSPYVGLFLFAPITILLSISLWDLYKKDRALSFLFVSIFVISLLFYGTLSFWDQGHTWGPRYLFSSIPLIVISLGSSLERRGKVFSRLVLGLSLVGFFVNSLGALFKWQVAIQEMFKGKNWYEHFASAPFFDQSHFMILHQLQVAAKGGFDLFFLHDTTYWLLPVLSVILVIETWYLLRLVLNSRNSIFLGSVA